MNRSVRYAVLIPLSLAAFYALFVLPDINLGWVGSIALLVAAWVVWYLLWATMQTSRAAAEHDDAMAPVSPGEQQAWVGLAFTAAMLIYYALRSPLMVGVDGGMAPEASIIGKHIGMLVVAWLVVMQLLRRYARDSVDEDERDRMVQARACRWSRSGLVVFVLAVAVMLAFSPQPRLLWAGPMAIANLLMLGLLASSALEYLVSGVSYWRDRH